VGQAIIILQCPQAQDGRTKVFPWSGVHHATGAKLHLAVRADRAEMVTLVENNKQVLCSRIAQFGVTAQ
jgi:hypothetical protein